MQEDTGYVFRDESYWLSGRLIRQATVGLPWDAMYQPFSPLFTQPVHQCKDRDRGVIFRDCELLLVVRHPTWAGGGLLLG